MPLLAGLCVEILTSSDVILGGGAFGSHCVGGALRRGIVGFMKRAPESSSLPSFFPVKLHGESEACARKGVLSWAWHASTPFSDAADPRTG